MEGSVDKPKDGYPRAAYVILSAEGKDLPGDSVSVAYDVEQVATRLI